MNNQVESLTYYSATKKYDLRFPTLTEDLDVDVVIIGGGFSGINTALELCEKGITNIAILEGRYLGYGGTGRNGGQVMAGIGHDLDVIKKHVGTDGLETIFKISNMGAAIIRERIAKYNIDADFCHGYAYLGSNQRQEKTLRSWIKEFQAITPDEDIEFYTGSEVRKVIGSDAYTSAIKHMGGGHVHSLNLLLGEAKAVSEYGAKIFENSQVLKVDYGDRVTVHTAMGSVRATKMLWACNAFLDGLEPALYSKTINTYAFQMMTEELSDDLINQISPIRGAYSDIRPVIDYYRVTRENRLLFGSATGFLEYIPADLKAWNRNLMLKVFPYLNDVKIELAWGGPMCCSANLFPQIGSLPQHKNVFFVQGYSGFGVTPSHIVCKVLAEGMAEGSPRYELMSSIPHATILGKDSLRNVIVSLGKIWHQTSGYWQGRR
ncbi:NAD(P)/FAD-dependent oxidoreductase [Moellerella wisconsensis]|uniref:FAD-binding oxidoreductase n=2 Tax=Moellerella wisconsensis TaxID=158849 RepID=A0ACD3Y659_9GAMM|nr:FAD-binding oxidoreductase [Moellerella wisconsensis]KLN96997.1 FAD-dependent oxidoreductase [Moellerella wisconsensis]UNH26877.1 FAD-binding oxidoreductase [Moellerella wisconsensis]UNH30361.1 FAD-binding oxidoreductase [Moellerella wisconsensis]UNH38520.1 FAD-binding oxidoreductase [Moellerella wisconsensis]UNH42035.1 FAD-binding oxidoreductase [Moellerella wisconsensis]